MHIEHAAILGRGAVGLLYGTVIADTLGTDAVTYVMDDARYQRHLGERISINGKPLELETVPASKATPADLVIVATKAPGLEQALDTMEALVGPRTCIISLINGIRSEQRIAERFGWDRTVLAIAQGMDAVFSMAPLRTAIPARFALALPRKRTPTSSPHSMTSSPAQAFPMWSSRTSGIAYGPSSC